VEEDGGDGSEEDEEKRVLVTHLTEFCFLFYFSLLKA